MSKNPDATKQDPAEAVFSRQLETPDLNLGEPPTEAAVEVYRTVEDLTPEEKDELAAHGRYLGDDSMEVALRRANGDPAAESFIRLCFRCASIEESARSAGTYRSAAELAAQAEADAASHTPNE